jgi:phage baseplate assembly protein V
MLSVEDVKRIMGPLGQRIMGLAGKATIERVDDSGAEQRVQATVLQNEVLDKLERLGLYGVTSNPQPGAAAVVLFLGGNRASGIVIATEDSRSRPTGLLPGEVAVYNDQGIVLLLAHDGKIHITADEVVLDCDVVAAGHSLAHHTHWVFGVETSEPTEI